MSAGRRVLGVIPARAGSKGVVGKNLRLINGRPLVGRAIESMRLSGAVDEIVVSTDGDDIAAVARSLGAAVIERPVELSTDSATSESALLHTLEAMGFDDGLLVFVQCTSPFIDPARLAHAIELVGRGDADVAFSAVNFHGFVWRTDALGRAYGANHDASVRPRRQDREPEMLETGAFYVMDVAAFVANRHRFFGKVVPIEVPLAHAIEIDEEADLELANVLATANDPLPSPSLAGVTALVTDFDGVHTDNRAIQTQDGTESVVVHRGDGMGVSLARRAGLDVLILSTETNPVVVRRAEKLQVACEAGHDDKLAVLQRWAADAGHEPASIAYLGNDVNDLDCLRWVGHPIVVADAHPAVADLGFLTTSLPGGGGAVREVVDRILESRPRPERPHREETLS